MNDTGGSNAVSVDLNEVMDYVKNTLSIEIKSKGAKITYSKLPSYYCYSTQMKLVFQNIIQNGIKYNNSKNPHIEVWSESKADSITLFFRDNGIGVEEEFHDTIFKFFKRLHTKQDYDGSGIGLGVCKKIINRLEGTISIESEKGKGSTFIVELPK